jgi:hypothetical protein
VRLGEGSVIEDLRAKAKEAHANMQKAKAAAKAAEEAVSGHP